MLREFVYGAARLSGLDLGDDDAIALNFLSPAEMTRINRKFLGHHRPTDVISFRYGEKGHARIPGSDVVAEIFVCPEAAEKYCHEAGGTEYHDEIALYIVHGILHAAGELDYTPSQRAAMRKREKQVLSKLSRKHDFKKIFAPSRGTSSPGGMKR